MNKKDYNPFKLDERVIIVTGGGGGIGRVYCERLAASGAFIVAADIDMAGAESCVAAIEQSGGTGLAVFCDISDSISVNAMVQKCVEHFGRVDGLVNNAALMSALPRGAWHEILEEDWDRVMAVNTRGLFLCCKSVWPFMKKQGGGKIVNISSNRVFDGTPNRLHYSTSKAGVIGFTRSLARELGDDNICVNAITPGFTASDSQMITSDHQYIHKMALINDRKAIKRTQTPDDIVGAMLFLLSPASDYISGQTINVDGGFVMH